MTPETKLFSSGTLRIIRAVVLSCSSLPFRLAPHGQIGGVDVRDDVIGHRKEGVEIFWRGPRRCLLSCRCWR
jgi:hypothetical protein